MRNIHVALFSLLHVSIQKMWKFGETVTILLSLHLLGLELSKSYINVGQSTFRARGFEFMELNPIGMLI